MIKKYNQYIKESLLDKLEGPTEQDVIKYYISNRDWDKLLYQSILFNNKEGVEIALKHKSSIKEFTFSKVAEYLKNYYRIDVKKDILYLLIQYDFVKYEYIIDIVLELNDVKTFELMLKSGFKIETSGTFRQHLKSHGINRDIIKIIINNHIFNSDIIDIILKANDIELMELYIKNGLDVNTYKINNFVVNGFIKHDMMKVLIEGGYDISYDFCIAFRISAFNGWLDCVKLCVEKGALVRILNSQALFQAAMNGHLDVVKYLVGKGANVESIGKLAIETARRNNHDDVVEYLEKIQKANESLLNKLEGPTEEELWNSIKNLSPLEILNKSIRAGFENGIIKALSLGATVNDLNFLFIKKLFKFLYENNKELLYKCIDDYNSERNRVNCFLFSCMYGYLDCVGNSINIYNIKPDVEDYKGLELAIKYNQINIVIYLINAFEYTNYAYSLERKAKYFADKYNNTEVNSFFRKR